VKKYTEHLNLRFDPFEPAASGKGLFDGGNRQQLLDQLIEHSLYSQSIMAVTGCLGCGKTTLAKTFCQSFGDEAVCAYVPATLFMNKGQFLEKLGEQIPVHLNDEETESAVVSIHSFASQLDLEAKALMIVIDDAHELGSDVLGLVTSIMSGSSTAIRVLMFGEVQLQRMLQNALAGSNDLTVVDFEISELGGDDTVEYVKFKLAEAGFDGELPVNVSELGNIHNLSNGVPGTINALVSNALEETNFSSVVREKLPDFLSSGSRYWAAAAVLVVLLLGAVIVMDPDPRLDQQQSLAATENSIAIPVSAESAAAAIATTESNADPVDQIVVTEFEQPVRTLEETAEASEEAVAEVVNAIDESAKPVELEPVEIATSEEAVSSELLTAGPAPNISAFEQELLEFSGSSFTVQIMGSHSETNVKRFVEDELTATKRGYFETRFQEKPWFVVVLGNFDNRADATKAIDELPASIQSLQPWIRTLADIQSDIRELNAIN